MKKLFKQYVIFQFNRVIWGLLIVAFNIYKCPQFFYIIWRCIDLYGTPDNTDWIKKFSGSVPKRKICLKGRSEEWSIRCKVLGLKRATCCILYAWTTSRHTPVAYCFPFDGPVIKSVIAVSLNLFVPFFLCSKKVLNASLVVWSLYKCKQRPTALLIDVLNFKGDIRRIKTKEEL